MKRTIAVLALLSIFALGVTLARADEAPSSTPSVPAQKTTHAHKAKKAKKTAAETWACPMGDYSGPKTADGKCPKCGMDLVKQKPAPAKKAKVKKEAKAPVGQDAQKVVWTCPMCGGSYDKAGKCPDCGMDLVQKK
ncbi:MAG TPA: heavy metal-binding domain-containing protein [bacterium]|nr:heavy metal-binding domain-containing protein [bacterium]